MPAARPPHPQRSGRAVAFGTCGELAQGVLPDGTPFLVTCPIDRGTAVEVRVEPAPAGLSISGVPRGLHHLTAALRRAAELIELGPSHLTVARHTALYVGTGMASSTADIAAAAQALARAVGLPLRAAELAELAAAIEPTDAVMYDRVVANDPATGALVRSWDWWPRFVVVMAIPGATRDTSSVVFTGQDALAERYAELLGRLDRAAAAHDAATFAQVATESAELNEAFVPSPMRTLLAPELEGSGALGLCVAHTGTVAGLLFAADAEGQRAAAQAARRLERAAPRGVSITTARTPASPVPAVAGGRRASDR